MESERLRLEAKMRENLAAKRRQRAGAVKMSNDGGITSDISGKEDELESGKTLEEAGRETTTALMTPHSRADLKGELQETLASQIPALIEFQSQEMFDKLHADCVLACPERLREFKADAVEIEEELKTAMAALDETERQTGKALAKELSSTLHNSGKEVEAQIRHCRQLHELARNKRKPGDAEKDLTNTVVKLLDKSEEDAAAREREAANTRDTIKRKIERLKDESSNAIMALTQALKRRQQQRLAQRMAQRREQQQKQIPVVSSAQEIAEMNAVMDKQEEAVLCRQSPHSFICTKSIDSFRRLAILNQRLGTLGHRNRSATGLDDGRANKNQDVGEAHV
ncbi:uncharacterized protein PITG_14078 [Phytophthora infestans T30-4]|uniref:Uncharacterized protein n=1 Tax=Phytophthora infestans (strain T30-4) TaxID=403677 RepID=D0NNK8_PHYIT|nr:uncharacterized protein PITG_14078 [Phytophthora infestans T30-4]EEY62179.1 conserved hypothetical protein [Phytophthora infestans T30-4]|eukprot:XP_002899210.1 conserved hypothetical protein [Phytophthora infestans T30-4]